MAASLNDANRQRLAKAGVTDMDPSAAFTALAGAIESRRPHVAIMSVDWTRYAEYRGAALPLLSQVDVTIPREDVRVPAPALLTALSDAPPERRRAVVLQHVRRDVLAVLGLATSARLDDEQGLRDAGLDSLMALELKNRLESSTRQALPSTIAFDYPTTAALADYVGALLGVSQEGVRIADAAAAEGVVLEALSEEEAAALLAEELAELNRARGTSSEYSRG